MSHLPGPTLVAWAKIVDYLLNVDSNTGGYGKAKFFFSFGFSLDVPERLKTALLQHALDHEVLVEEVTAGGVKRVLECTMRTPDGRNPCIRTVWVQEVGREGHRLVTALPGKRRPS